MDTHILLTGLGIFLARICDVSIGTVRTISTVQGRIALAFCLGIGEILIWISVISTVIRKIEDAPILIVFYALGYATGNVVGILVEKKLAFGTMIVRVITPSMGKEMAKQLRDMGQPVTTFVGEGLRGPVTELYIGCKRRDMNRILDAVHGVDPNAFYITEQAGAVSKILRPTNIPTTGWRAVFKKK